MIFSCLCRYTLCIHILFNLCWILQRKENRVIFSKHLLQHIILWVKICIISSWRENSINYFAEELSYPEALWWISYWGVGDQYWGGEGGRSIDRGKDRSQWRAGHNEGQVTRKYRSQGSTGLIKERAIIEQGRKAYHKETGRSQLRGLVKRQGAGHEAEGDHGQHWK